MPNLGCGFDPLQSRFPPTSCNEPRVLLLRTLLSRPVVPTPDPLPLISDCDLGYTEGGVREGDPTQDRAGGGSEWRPKVEKVECVITDWKYPAREFGPSTSAYVSSQFTLRPTPFPPRWSRVLEDTTDRRVSVSPRGLYEKGAITPLRLGVRPTSELKS